jgi:NADH dehydrogenase
MNDGRAFGGKMINRFNGGLFDGDEELEKLQVPNSIFCQHLQGSNEASLHSYKETLLYLWASYNYASDLGRVDGARAFDRDPLNFGGWRIKSAVRPALPGSPPRAGALAGSAFRAKPARMKRHQIAVMGGAGFVGRYVVKRLVERGEVLTVGGRHATGAKYLKLKGDVGQVGLVNIAIGDAEPVLRAFVAGKDALVNCVGILYERGAQKFAAVHHAAPAKLARLAREAGVERLVHISAIGADPRSPSAYARSKAAGEQAVKDAFPTATILRPSIVFGPEDDFFNRFAALAVMSPFVPLIGGGETRFQPVYVGDVASAVTQVLDDPATAGRTYELGGPQVFTFRQLMELMLGEIKRRRHFVDLPFGVASLQARFLSLLPKPPLTPDQVEMLRRDNVVAAGALDLGTLGIAPTAVEAILPSYLDRFRRRGWYDRSRAVA